MTLCFVPGCPKCCLTQPRTNAGTLRGVHPISGRAQEPHWHRTPVQVWWWDSPHALRAVRQFAWLKVGTGKEALPRPGRAPGWCPISPTSTPEGAYLLQGATQTRTVGRQVAIEYFRHVNQKDNLPTYPFDQSKTLPKMGRGPLFFYYNKSANLN